MATTVVIDPLLSADPLIPSPERDADVLFAPAAASASSSLMTSAVAANHAATATAFDGTEPDAVVAAEVAAAAAAVVVAAVSAAVTSFAQVAAVTTASSASSSHSSLIILPAREGNSSTASTAHRYDENENSENLDTANYASFEIHVTTSEDGPKAGPREPLKENKEDGEQPLLTLLRQHPIFVPTHCDKDPDQLRQLLREIDSFVAACDDLLAVGPRSGHEGRAPGFWTAAQHHDKWSHNLVNSLPYQCWVDVTNADDENATTKKNELPAPSVLCARRCYEMARTLVELRLEHVLSTAGGGKPACACVGAWDHVDGNVMVQLINQGVEQLMCQEASEILHKKLTQKGLDAWNASYTHPDTAALASVELEYHPSTPIQIVASRDVYLGAFVEAAVASTSAIQISTCYLFWDDPAHRYVLIDLLPHLVRTRGVKVQLLVDLLVVESFTVRSAMTFPSCGASADSTDPRERRAAHAMADRATSFVQHLPPEPHRPAITAQEFDTPFHFLQALLDLSHEYPDLYQIQFWSARDAQEKYCVKSHVKCAVFDRQVALIGGSNISPTVKSAFSDLDALVAGKAAAAIGDSFDTLWSAMAAGGSGSGVPTPRSSPRSTAESMDNPDLERMVARRTWQDPSASVAILRSAPSSDGNDVIFRVVLDKIRQATSEVLVCMGHSSYCKAFAQVVADATQRGARVRILVNTQYSNDLRNGQADLFLSLRDLLAMAPAVEVYATTMPHLRDPTLDPNLPRPEFIHAKYVVVDRQWSATGSWNLWTRSAFYEIENEAFIQSAPVAEALCDKFERDRLAHSILVAADDCAPGGPFCPRGCAVCDGFGPFFKHGGG